MTPAPMADEIGTLKTFFLSAIASATTEAELEAVRVSALGKKGSITALTRALGTLSPEERKTRGAELNTLKNDILAVLDKQKKILSAAAMQERLVNERLDVTLPIRPEAEGRVHPTPQTIEEIVTIFASMGFAVAKGPDIETEYYNFEALNIPSSHPARDMQATFFLPSAEKTNQTVLRTQTSPVQIRTMLHKKPPIRIIAPGRTYRCDYDQTHTPMFHQVEGLVIDEKTNMGHLKGCVMDFLRAFFGIDDLPVRFRPSYFPFTEPSAEVDIGCSRAGGELKLGNYGDWLEIMGCGMVHPNVLKNCGLDPEKHQGFAFGMGIERLAMLKYGIPDLRTFFDADMRWLRHYGFMPFDIPNPALRG
ncbi:MAG: phenylalanine--tRNA ligase subunit alpha [Alphaproteobacteria bacterium]|nr:phenylalanine--tRNA ligase subunit alpha [Alphaproteobacteria bacterium]